MTEEKEMNEQERYQEEVRLIKLKDQEIETLKKDVEELREMMKKNAEKSEDQKIAGYCNNCNRPVTVQDVKRSVCPHCGAPDYYADDPRD